MDNFILVGKIINTFGIKGELKIVSDFEYKDQIFKPGFSFYIGELKIKEVVVNHRVHKNYDLTTFEGYNNINEVLKYIGMNVYIRREDLRLGKDEYLLSDLVGFSVYDEKELLGIVIDYEKTPSSVLLKIKGEKTFYLPHIPVYIKEVDCLNKRISTNKGRDLII